LPEVGPVQEFFKAAFSLGPEEISSAVAGSQAYYLLRGKEKREPSVPPLQALRAEIEKRLREARSFELASERANALLSQLKKDRDIKKLAHQHGLRLEETGWFPRSNPQIPKVGALQEIRPGGIPVSSLQAVSHRIYTEKGAAYLFAFKESRGADMEQFEKEKDRLEEQTLAEKKRRALQRFIDSLKAAARIEVKAQFLEEG